MSPAPEKIGNLSIIDQIGPFFIGIILNYLFLGVLVHQLYDYHRNYSNDRWAVKWFVYGVCILDIVQTGFTTHVSWYYCVQNWGNVEVFTIVAFTWTASILPITAGIVAMLVQGFYAWRIWSLGGRWLKSCSVLIALVAILECVCALVGGIKYDIVGILAISPSTVPFFVIWLAGSFTCDVLIAGCMTIIFTQIKRRSAFEKTSSVLNVLIRHIVETAAITAISAGVSLILFVSTRNQSQANTVPGYILGKLYTNCLLANLNNRKFLAQSMDSEGWGNAMNSFRLRNVGDRKKNSTSAIVDLAGIRVEHVHHVQRDQEENSTTMHGSESKEISQNGNFVKDDASDAFAYKAEETATHE